MRRLFAIAAAVVLGCGGSPARTPGAAVCGDGKTCDEVVTDPCLAAVSFLDGASTSSGVQFRDDDAGEGLDGDPGACGGAGKQLVFRYDPPDDGLLIYQLQNALAVNVSVRRTCAQTATEVSCERASPFVGASNVGRAEVTKGEPVWIVVNAAGADQTNAPFRLVTRYLPLVSRGGRCDVNGTANACGHGDLCDASGRCVESTPPELEWVSYQPAQGGSALFLRGIDTEGDLSAVHIEFQQQNGSPVLVDLDGSGVPETSVLDLPVVAFQAEVNDGEFLLLVGANGLERVVPQVRVTLEDVAGLRSQPVVAELEFPTRAAGEACELTGLKDTCATGQSCDPAAALTCRDTAVAQAAACDAAPELVPGDATPLHLFANLRTAPPDCSDKPGIPSPGLGLEAVARLHVEGDGTSVVHVRTSGTADTQVYLLPSCEIDAEPIGCADDTSTTDGNADLRLEDVAAGDYVVVVDSWNFVPRDVEVTVTIE